MSHADDRSLDMQLAERFYQLIPRSQRFDFRPFSSIGAEAQAPWLAMAKEALRIASWNQHGVSVSGPTTIETTELRFDQIVPVTKVVSPARTHASPLTLPPADWLP